MPIWSTSTITRFIQDGENLVAKEFNFLLDRVALNIVAGTSKYALPSSFHSISQVTWKGKFLAPVSSREYRTYFPYMSSNSVPEFYLFDQLEQNQIQFFPTPSETIGSTASNLWGAEIANRVIIEAYRIPDGSTFRLPAYIRRRFVKLYVLYKCFAQEGPGQNLKLSNYYKKRFFTYLEYFKELFAGHFVAKIWELEENPLVNEGNFPPFAINKAKYWSYPGER